MTTGKVTVRVFQPSNDEILRPRPKALLQARSLGLPLKEICYKLDWNGLKTYGNLAYFCPDCFSILAGPDKQGCVYIECLHCREHSICIYEPCIKDGFAFVSVLLAPDQRMCEIVRDEGQGLEVTG